MTYSLRYSPLVALVVLQLLPKGTVSRLSAIARIVPLLPNEANVTSRALQSEETPTPSYTFVNCYNDGNPRALKWKKGHAATHEDCAIMCAREGHGYFGRQYKKECWCGGQDYDAYGISTQCKGCQSSSTENYGKGVNCVFDLELGQSDPVYQTPLWKFVGCFWDTKGPKYVRDLEYYEGIATTIDDCAQRCANIAQPHMGLQWKKECWCGKYFGRHGRSNACHGCLSSSTKNYGGLKNCVFEVKAVQSLPWPIQKFEGCYSDNARNGLGRDLPDYQGIHSSQRCAELCKEKGYEYMGMQWKHECRCGHHFGWHGTAGSFCNDCTNNSSEGHNFGAWSNCVFSISGAEHDLGRVHEEQITFVYGVTDNRGNHDRATVTITITGAALHSSSVPGEETLPSKPAAVLGEPTVEFPSDDIVVAQDDSYRTDKYTFIEKNITLNDSDLLEYPLTVEEVGPDKDGSFQPVPIRGITFRGVTTDGEKRGSMTVYFDGTLRFYPENDFYDLAP